MKIRTVLRVMRDREGEISFLFGRWGSVDRAQAIRQIESGQRQYFLRLHGGAQAVILVVSTETSKQLRAHTIDGKPGAIDGVPVMGD